MDLVSSDDDRRVFIATMGCRDVKADNSPLCNKQKTSHAVADDRREGLDLKNISVCFVAAMRVGKKGGLEFDDRGCSTVAVSTYLVFVSLSLAFDTFLRIQDIRAYDDENINQRGQKSHAYVCVQVIYIVRTSSMSFMFI